MVFVSNDTQRFCAYFVVNFSYKLSTYVDTVLHSSKLEISAPACCQVDPINDTRCSSQFTFQSYRVAILRRHSEAWLFP